MTARRGRRWLMRLVGVVAAMALAVVGLAASGFARPAFAGSVAANTRATLDNATASPPPAYAYYYLWWSTAHWHSLLGPNYPYADNPLPLPATLGSTGCSPTSKFAGNKETDVPASLFTEDDQSQIDLDVANAIATGLAGFAVDWVGTGSTTQAPNSTRYNARLDMLVRAVDAAQAAGHDFHLWLSYEASAVKLSQSHIANDLGYFSEQYGSDPAFGVSNGGKATFIWVGSYKYSTAIVHAISAEYRPYLYFVGGYQYNSWTPTVAPYFDADSPYWSSQDPYNNPQSFSHLAGLATTLHAEGKEYFAPLTPGFDRQLDGSSGCVPRDGGATLQTVYKGNAAAHPDGWLVISWNEITEGTYVTPQLQRYGATYGGPNGYLHAIFGAQTGAAAR